MFKRYLENIGMATLSASSPFLGEFNLLLTLLKGTLKALRYHDIE
jgi:hypothetical protein